MTRFCCISLSLSLSLVRCLDAPAAALVDVLQYCRMERAAACRRFVERLQYKNIVMHHNGFRDCYAHSSCMYEVHSEISFLHSLLLADGVLLLLHRSARDKLF
jgi:hypothetical protein